MNFCQLQLTCADKSEADKIAKVLLEKRLIACAKQISITSEFRWQGKLEQGEEILLLLDSREDLFDEIETEISKIHSYETFVLISTPITKVSKEASDWMRAELK